MNPGRKLLRLIDGVRFIVVDKDAGWHEYLQLRQDLAGERFDVMLQMQTSARANLSGLCVRADFFWLGWRKMTLRGAAPEFDRLVGSKIGRPQGCTASAHRPQSLQVAALAHHCASPQRRNNLPSVTDKQACRKVACYLLTLSIPGADSSLFPEYSQRGIMRWPETLPRVREFVES